MKFKLEYWKINIGIYAIIWSLIIGILTAGYLNLVNWVINIIWHEFFSSPTEFKTWYPFIICLPFGFLIGFLSHKLGNYPLTIEEVLTKVRMRGKLDYHNWWKSFTLGLLVLGAGGSVGPEASTTVLTNSMINWLGDRLRWSIFCHHNGQENNIWQDRLNRHQLESAPLFSQLFRSKKQKNLIVSFLVIIGILGAAIVFKLFPEEGVFGIHHHTINWQWENLLTAIPIMIVGIAFGWLFIRLENWSALIINVKLSKVWQGGIFGLILATCSLLSNDILFSGEFRIVPFSHEALTLSVPLLLSIAFVKAVVTNLGFSMGWRGGTIFPAIFSSLAIGCACALVLPGDVRVNAVIVLAASLTVILGKPLLTSILLILLVPIELTPVIITVSIATNWLVKKFLPNA